MTETPTAQHVFRFELWPPEDQRPPYSSYPMFVPDMSTRVTAATPAEAYEKVAPQVPAGWTAQLAQHFRYDCQPPHGGRDVPYAKEA